MLRTVLQTLLISGAVLLGPSAMAQEGPIKIGVLADMAGTSADAGGPGSVAAVRIAVEEFGGKIGNRAIEVVSADHQQKPDVALSIVGRWYDVENVNVVTDVAITSVALAVQKAANDRKKAVLITNAFSESITNQTCSAYSIHWATDTYALAQGMPRAVVKSGGKSWFFLTYDYTFGILLQESASKVIKAEGGTIVGDVRTPLGLLDYSSFLLQAQASKAQIVGLTAVGTSLINAIKQASEFGITAGGQKLVGFLVFISDIHSLGLDAANGLYMTSPYYWDDNEQTRAFAKKFKDKQGVMPTDSHAANYAAVVHYLKAVQATGSTDADKTMSWMRKNKASYFGKDVEIRADGRVMYDPALYEVKKKSESKYEWDYLKKISSFSAKDAFLPFNEEKCGPLKNLP